MFADLILIFRGFSKFQTFRFVDHIYSYGFQDLCFSKMTDSYFSKNRYCHCCHYFLNLKGLSTFLHVNLKGLSTFLYVNLMGLSTFLYVNLKGLSTFLYVNLKRLSTFLCVNLKELLWRPWIPGIQFTTICLLLFRLCICLLLLRLCIW